MAALVTALIVPVAWTTFCMSPFLHLLGEILRRLFALIAESREQPDGRQEHANDRPFVLEEFHFQPPDRITSVPASTGLDPAQDFPA